MNSVELLFKEQGIKRVGTFIYPKLVAIDFINECKKLKIGILGINALIIKGKFTQPSMDNSIDFTASTSRQNPPENVWDAALKFLKEREDIYYFEIVCSTEV